MTPDNLQFRTGVIKPVECLKEGWALLKDQYWLCVVGGFIGLAVPVVLLGPMMSGIFLCLFQRMRNEKVEFADLFKGFDYFVPSLIVAVIRIVPILLLIVPFYIIMFTVMFSTMPRGRGNPGEAPGFLFAFFGIEIVFVVVLLTIKIVIESLFLFAFPLVVDRKLSGLEAIKLSIKAARANLGGVAGLVLLNEAIAIVGAFCCIVGIYFVLPVTFAADAVAYRRVFPEGFQNFASPPPPPASWAA